MAPPQSSTRCETTREISVLPLHARQLLSQPKPNAIGPTSSMTCPTPTLACRWGQRLVHPHSSARYGACENVGHDGRELAAVRQCTCRSHLCLRLFPTKLLRARCPSI